MKKTLIFGFGNIGRQDDGLGILIAEKIETLKLENVETDSNYQLNVEDSLRISEFDRVIFVDASYVAQAPYEFKELEAAMEIQFSTHAMNPSSILALSQEYYNKKPEASILTIPGYQWEIGEGLSEKAQENFDKAYEFLKGQLAIIDSMA